MPFEYLDDLATADVAFRATGQSREELFVAACDALVNVMLTDLKAIADKKDQSIIIEDPNLDMLLFQLMQELIYLKDAQKLILRVREINIKEERHAFVLKARVAGEQIDLSRHHFNVDVKAVTLHRFQVRQIDNGWEAIVVLDI